MKKTILAVSFGTSDALARETCIAPVEEAFAQAYPEHEVRRAFTSGFIRRKLAKEGIIIEGAEDAISELRAQGKEFVIASTHIIPGQEYEKLCAAAGDVKVTQPLLMTDDDLEQMAEILRGIHDQVGGTLIVMGHGTEHAANETYYRLREKLPHHVYLACVEGDYTLDNAISELPCDPGCITLMPLMLVAGDHARNDMAGDEPDSWKSILQAKGFTVKARLKGLGSESEVRRMFVEKLRKVMDN